MSQLPHQPSGTPINIKTSVLKRVRRLSYLLDNSIPIPGTSYRIGIDPLLGLVPGAGDFVGMALSAYIVLEATRLGLPRATLVKMVSNILFETVFGSVPVVGDVLDATWKANARNLALLEGQLDIPKYPSQKRRDWWFVGLLLLGLFLVVIIIAAISIVFLKWVLNALSG
ncbi:MULTISPECIES: DUF4112 domain-containing protein [unclassified Coleofasciculus]|uniref:DUF4112 domain-containing protein n=1 Tax=unclassified Coleofasciculus TaxID=2692782 RepID=UPI00187DFA3F|nr:MULTISPECIES: DUF4112 domain-containing protein [unclassified Coleofasciculus]MBE9129833.1 DUF4112 domain-containing protein [Coleofasciculus sp. LEGE 07081]MBE9151958.1 DUF4112 domain-containing protein [Coleofasciculus sp. LEGE 07092]